MLLFELASDDMFTETCTGFKCGSTERKDGKNVQFKRVKCDMEIKDNKLTINIPEGMEIDIENSDFKAGVIKFKKEDLTYGDIVASLDSNAKLIPTYTNCEKVIAISKLMDIAKFYNGDWKPDWSNIDEPKFFILYDNIDKTYTDDYYTTFSSNTVYFKHKEDVQAVIDNHNFREILDAIFKN